MASLPTTSTTSALAYPINLFSASTFQQIHANNPGDNVFLSPLGICTALTLLMLGSRSSTEQQLMHSLGYDDVLQQQNNKNKTINVHLLYQELLESRFSKDPSLALSNFVVLPVVTSSNNKRKKNQVVNQYDSLAKSYYGAEVEFGDFAVDGLKMMKRINNWVKEKTHGMIGQIMDSPPDPMTRLMLLNAIYFKGRWRSQFDKEETTKGVFHGSDGRMSMTDFMVKYDEKLPYMSYRFMNVGSTVPTEVHVIELAYEQSNTSMIIMIPKDRSSNPISHIVSSKTFKSNLLNMTSLMTHNMRSRKKINLWLPKFKLETDYDMNPILSQIGIKEIFTSDADLSGIDGKKDLSVSSIRHKAVVAVDEEGTEAAAVTSIMVRTLSLNPVINVRIDHPFLFVIMDRISGVILFIGKVDHL